jgi:hypothetical protein
MSSHELVGLLILFHLGCLLGCCATVLCFVAPDVGFPFVIGGQLLILAAWIALAIRRYCYGIK